LGEGSWVLILEVYLRSNGIHTTVWPQYTNVTDRTDSTDRQDNGPIA